MVFVRSLLVLAAVVLPSQSKPFRPRGIPVAPYANLTSTSTSASAAPTLLFSSSSTLPTPSSWTSSAAPVPYPTAGTGAITRPSGGFAKPTNLGTAAIGRSSRKNDTGPPCTVYVPSATLDWWFAATFAYAEGSMATFEGANYTEAMLSYMPNTETFDLTSALYTDGAYTETTSFDPDYNLTFTWFDQYTVTPSATVTSIITRHSAQPLPSSIIPATDFSLYEIEQLDATIAITGATGTVFAATSTTPILYFSAYEVETAFPVARENGTVRSSTVTQTISLTEPYVLPYWINGIENSSVASGTVPTEFLQQIPQSLCAPGTFQATVTVLYVVDYFYINFPEPQPFIVHIESSVLGLDDPGPTSTSENVHAEQTGDSGGGPFLWSFLLPSKAASSTDHSTDHAPFVQPTATGLGSPNVKGGPLTSTGAKPQGQASSGSGDGHNAVGTVGQISNPPEPSKVIVGTIGTEPVIIGPSSVVIVGSQTLIPGQPAITVGGIQVSLAPSASAVVVDGQTSFLPPVVTAPINGQSPPILTIGSSTLTANAATQFFIGPGQTLTPGGTATVDGTVVSLGPSASFVVVGGSTQILPTAGAANTFAPEIVVGGTTFVANPGSTFVIDGQTLVPGQQITVSGTTLSLGPSASFAVINGATSAIANPAALVTPPPLTIGTGIFTASPGSGTTYVISGSTLTPGGQIVVDGSTISLASGATALIINGQTTTLNTGAGPITNAPLLTIGSHTYTAVSGTTFVIDGQTLTLGGVITVDGTTISLAPGATELVYGTNSHSTTETLFPATTTRTQSITGTNQASAGATGLPDGVQATSTNSKGVGHMVTPSSIEGWGLYFMIGFAGLVLG